MYIIDYYYIYFNKYSHIYIYLQYHKNEQVIC